MVETNVKKNWAGLLVAAAVFIIICLLPTPEGLEPIGKYAFAIMISAIILLVTEAVSISVTALIILSLLPTFGVMTLPATCAAAMSPAIVFIIAGFILTAALMKTKIPSIIALRILRWAGTNPRKVVFGFTCCTAVLSAFISDVPAVLVFYGLGMTLLKANGDPKPGSSQFAKALMIGIPIGSLIGGIATPAGCSVNVLAMSLLEQASGISITFLQWCAVGTPIAIIMTLFAAWTLPFFFKCEPLKQEAIDTLEADLKEKAVWSTLDKKVGLIFLVLIVLWIAGNWIAILNVTVVAMLGVVVMMLPGMNIMARKEFSSSVSWDLIMMLMGVLAMANGLLTSGAVDWFVGVAFSGAASWSPLMVLLLMSVVAALLHVAVPVGHTIVALLIFPFVALGETVGISAVVVCMILSIWGNFVSLLATDGIPMVTFTAGYYKMTDMLKSGWITTLAMIALCVFLVPLLCKMIGY